MNKRTNNSEVSGRNLATLKVIDFLLNQIKEKENKANRIRAVTIKRKDLPQKRAPPSGYDTDILHLQLHDGNT